MATSVVHAARAGRAARGRPGAGEPVPDPPSEALDTRAIDAASQVGALTWTARAAVATPTVGKALEARPVRGADTEAHADEPGGPIAIVSGKAVAEGAPVAGGEPGAYGPAPAPGPVRPRA